MAGHGLGRRRASPPVAPKVLTVHVPTRFFVLTLLAAEVLATVLVAQHLGAWETFVWLVLAFVLGVVVMRRAGSQAFDALRGTREPTGAVAGDSVLLFVAGLLLAVPGVLTDVVGLLLLIPPLGEGVRRWVVRAGGRRFPNVRSTFTAVRLADGSIVIPGEVIDEPIPGETPRDRPGGGAPPDLPPAH